MGTKSISSTLTVNTVEDGVSQPSYMQTQEAWSNQTTSASSSTMPSDCQESDWKDYTPTKDKTYLWRRSRTMTLNSNNQYVAGSWTYQRLSGDNGTSVNPKGTVDFAYSTKSGFPPASSSLYGKTAVAKGSNKIYKCDIPSPGYYDWLETGGTASAGDSYTVDAGNLNGNYQSTNNMHGHFIMWSSEASQWIDLGLFQGESGETYYTHIAWATGTTDPTQEHPAPSPSSGQTSIPNKYAVTGFSVAPFDGAKWMGVLVNQTVADSTTDNLYTWSYSKGEDAVDYKISFAGSQFAIDPNEDELRINIKGKVYKIVGNATSAYTDLVDSQLSLYFEDSQGNKDYLTTSDFSVSGATFSTTYYDGTGWSDEQVFVAVLTIGGVEVARESIQIEKYGQNGQNGQRGKMSRNIYYAGKWNELTGNVHFDVTDYSAPYVDISEEGTGQICKVYVGSNGTKTFPTTRQGYLNSSDWDDMATDFKYIITQAIFSSFAKLGSFVISGDYFISQYGTLLYNNSGNIQKTTIDSTNVSALFDGRVAYAWFDDSDPMAETNPSLGNYKFRPTKCMDALSGDEWMAGGNIAVKGNGDVDIIGTIRAKNLYHNVCLIPAAGEYSNDVYYVYDNTHDDFWEEHPEYHIGDYITIPHNTTLPDGIHPCTYNADVVVMIPNNIDWEWPSNGNICYLPKPSDFVGKIVEVNMQGSCGENGKIMCVDSSQNYFIHSPRFDGQTIVDADTYGPYAFSTVYLRFSVQGYQIPAGGGTYQSIGWREIGGKRVLYSDGSHWITIE